MGKWAKYLSLIVSRISLEDTRKTTEDILRAKQQECPLWCGVKKNKLRPWNIDDANRPSKIMHVSKWFIKTLVIYHTRLPMPPRSCGNREEEESCIEAKEEEVGAQEASSAVDKVIDSRHFASSQNQLNSNVITWTKENNNHYTKTCGGCV